MKSPSTIKPVAIILGPGRDNKIEQPSPQSLTKYIPLSLGIDDIGVTATENLTSAKLDDNHVVISGSEDSGAPVAVGFRART